MTEFEVITNAFMRVDPHCLEIFDNQYIGNDKYGKIIYIKLGCDEELEMDFDENGTLISYY